MWGRELRMSSYRWPLLSVLCCLREGKRDAQLCCHKGRKKKTQRGEERKWQQKSLSWQRETRQAFHHAIIIRCHPLPSNPKLLFAGGSFLTTRQGGGGSWPANSYCHLLFCTEQHCAETWPTSSPTGGGCVWLEEHAHRGAMGGGYSMDMCLVYYV